MQPAVLDFQPIYEQYHDRILRYLERLLGESEAPEVDQEVFLRISRSLQHFRGESSLSTWIYRIATHAAIDRLRSSSFHADEAAQALDEELPPPAAERDALLPDEIVMRREMYDCFDRYVKDLPPAYRPVVVLRDVENLPVREIASILDLTLPTVKIRLHRGRALLFDRLRRHCKADDWL